MNLRKVLHVKSTAATKMNIKMMLNGATQRQQPVEKLHCTNLVRQVAMELAKAHVGIKKVFNAKFVEILIEIYLNRGKTIS